MRMAGVLCGRERERGKERKLTGKKKLEIKESNERSNDSVPDIPEALTGIGVRAFRLFETAEGV